MGERVLDNFALFRLVHAQHELIETQCVDGREGIGAVICLDCHVEEHRPENPNA